MPTRDRMLELYRRLIEAAMDQPAPTKELTKALNDVLRASEHHERVVAVRRMEEVNAEIFGY